MQTLAQCTALSVLHLDRVPTAKATHVASLLQSLPRLTDVRVVPQGVRLALPIAALDLRILHLGLEYSWDDPGEADDFRGAADELVRRKASLPHLEDLACSVFVDGCDALQNVGNWLHSLPLLHSARLRLRILLEDDDADTDDGARDDVSWDLQNLCVLSLSFSALGDNEDERAFAGWRIAAPRLESLSFAMTHLSADEDGFVGVFADNAPASEEGELETLVDFLRARPWPNLTTLVVDASALVLDCCEFTALGDEQLWPRLQTLRVCASGNSVDRVRVQWLLARRPMLRQGAVTITEHRVSVADGRRVPTSCRKCQAPRPTECLV
jgi:hypothetical protein